MRGRLGEVADQGFTLKLSKHSTYEHSFDRVASIRKRGMSGKNVLFIVAGVIAALYVTALVAWAPAGSWRGRSTCPVGAAA